MLLFHQDTIGGSQPLNTRLILNMFVLSVYPIHTCEITRLGHTGDWA